MHRPLLRTDRAVRHFERGNRPFDGGPQEGNPAVGIPGPEPLDAMDGPVAGHGTDRIDALRERGMDDLEIGQHESVGGDERADRGGEQFTARIPCLQRQHGRGHAGRQLHQPAGRRRGGHIARQRQIGRGQPGLRPQPQRIIPVRRRILHQRRDERDRLGKRIGGERRGRLLHRHRRGRRIGCPHDGGRHQEHRDREGGVQRADRATEQRVHQAPGRSIRTPRPGSPAL